MRTATRTRVAAIAATALAGLALAGCTSALSVLDPDFLSAVGLGERVSTVPGDAPAILVLVQNGTDRIIDARLSWRVQRDEVDSRIFTIDPGEELGEVLLCPIEELTLGDVGDLSRLGAAVRLGTGRSDDPFIEVEAFGVLLKDGVNYDCGDRITFAVLPSSATRSGYQIIAFIQRAVAP